MNEFRVDYVSFLKDVKVSMCCLFLC